MQRPPSSHAHRPTGASGRPPSPLALAGRLVNLLNQSQGVVASPGFSRSPYLRLHTQIAFNMWTYQQHEDVDLSSVWAHPSFFDARPLLGNPWNASISRVKIMFDF